VTDDQTTTPTEAPPDDQTYTFNWHKLNDIGNSDEEFLRWMLVNLVTQTSDEVEAGVDQRNLLDRLRDASSNFTDVRLSISANGVELNVIHFVRSLRSIMNHWTRQEASRRLAESVDFTELTKIVDAFRRAVSTRARQVANALNVELDEEDDW
jgi:hypothetical protein